MIKPSLISSSSRITLAVVISIFAGFLTLSSAWISQSVATSVSQTEISNLKSSQNKTEEKLDMIGDKLSEISGTLKEMQRQDVFRFKK